MEGDWFGAVEVDTGRAVLFCPRFPEDYATWMGQWVLFTILNSNSDSSLTNPCYMPLFTFLFE